jgi:hypothetical protein
MHPGGLTVKTVIEPKLMTVPEVARAYRIRDSVVRSLCRLGKLKSIKRKGRGRTGEVVLICPKSASLVLGVGS